MRDVKKAKTRRELPRSSFNGISALLGNRVRSDRNHRGERETHTQRPDIKVKERFIVLTV